MGLISANMKRVVEEQRKGTGGAVGTTVGMLQYALPFCILLASSLGWIGGSLGSGSNLIARRSLQ